MTFFYVMGALILTFGFTSYYMLRRGGTWNPDAVTHDFTEPSDTPPEPPVVPVVEPPAPKPTLIQLCTAIRDFEGKPGDANYRNNNPGNCRYNPSGYLAIYGNVKRSPNGFAIFPTYELGWLYLRNMLAQQIRNHPNWTLLDLITNYAPPSDDNPTRSYATFVARRLGVDNVFLVKNLL